MLLCGPFFEIGLATLDQCFVENVRALVQITNGFEVIAATNIMTADDEAAPIVEIDTVKNRRGGHQAGRVREFAIQGGNAEHRGGGDSAECADQP